MVIRKASSGWTSQSRGGRGMIQNDRQHRITRQQMRQLERALRDAEAGPAPARVPAVVREGQLNSLRFQIADLKQELAEYERLRDEGPAAATTHLSSLADLPGALIRARIAQNLTQRDLAG